MAFERETDVALAAVREAAALCRRVQGSVKPETLEKKDKSPVTIADFGSQALVCRALREAFPDDLVIAEEGAAELHDPANGNVRDRLMEEIHVTRPDASFDDVCTWIDHGNHRDPGDRFWTLDPIDGTKGFLRGDQYAISLALIEKGEIVFGVLGCPNMGAYIPDVGKAGALFIAVRGDGATVQAIEGDLKTPVHVSGLSDASEARFCESFESGHSDHSWSNGVAKRLEMSREGVRMDSQAKYAAVAMGLADLYLRLPTRADYREKIWDHAAGVLVVQEAGGIVSDVDGKPLDFTRGYRLEENRGVIVSGGRFHDQVVDAVLEVEHTL